MKPLLLRWVAAIMAGLLAVPAQGQPPVSALGNLDADPVRGRTSMLSLAEHGSPHPGRSGALTPDERRLAEAAWRYFQNNTQPSTGLVNAADKYPSTTIWDTGSSIGAIISANGLGLIDANEAGDRLGKMLDTLTRLPLFRDMCPNKAYNTITAGRVTYTNQPGEIGCSALDVGRLLYWLRVVQQRFPALGDKAAAVASHLQPANLVREGQMFGVSPHPGGGVDFLQEGRLGYEEYAAKGFRLWGFDTREAARAEPYGLISLYGVKVPYDTRDPRVTGAHNYVVTESYVLDGIEYGWDEADDSTSGPSEHSSGWIARSANHVYLAQQRRFERTGILTARTEHQLLGAPYFVYDTIYSDGQPWATITDTGESHPEAAAVALKGAIGMWVLWPTPYTDHLFEAVKGALDPERGVYEGLLESGKGRIETFTANNNGIILESLLYKIEGKLLRPDPGSIPPLKASADAPVRRPAAGVAEESQAMAMVQPTSASPPVPELEKDTSVPGPEVPSDGLSTHAPISDELEMAKVAWRYFQNNTQGATGLVNAVEGYPSTTLWDAAAGFGAVIAADRFGIIDHSEAVGRLSKALDTFSSMQLFQGICPNKVYDTRNARPTDYSNKPGEIGCSALDTGRMLIWLKVAEQRYPELKERVERTVRHWQISGFVRGGELYGARANQTSVRDFVQEGRLGYEEYSAKGFNLWGLDTPKAASPEPFDTVRIEGIPIMHDRRSHEKEGGLNAVVTETFVLEGVEFGFGSKVQPGSGWLKAAADNVILAQQKRYERTGILTARTEHQLMQPPHFVYDSVFSEGTIFATQDIRGREVPSAAAVASKAAFGIWTLWPGRYGDLLYAAVRKAFDGGRGFYEGVLEKGGLIRAFTANTNGIILEILLYRLDGAIVGHPPAYAKPVPSAG